MSELVDTLIDGLIDREQEIGSRINWAGQDMACSGGSSKEGKMLDIGGFKPNAAVTIVLRVSLLEAGSGLPKSKQSLVYASSPGAPTRSLRIDAVNTLYNSILVLECNDPSQGA